jgi:hypothetical protein
MHFYSIAFYRDKGRILGYFENVPPPPAAVDNPWYCCLPLCRLQYFFQRCATHTALHTMASIHEDSSYSSLHPHKLFIFYSSLHPHGVFILYPSPTQALHTLPSPTRALHTLDFPYKGSSCSLSRWRAAHGSKRMSLDYTHGLFIT